MPAETEVFVCAKYTVPLESTTGVAETMLNVVVVEEGEDVELELTLEAVTDMELDCD